MEPFAIISDSHNHNWNAFSYVLDTGINNRLQMILDETTRAAGTVAGLGGNKLFHGGDLFHVRGAIAPSVLNPTKDCYKNIIAKGVNVIIVAGNHDLEGKDATRISSAITSLEDIGCVVINEPTIYEDHYIVPWIPNMMLLKRALEKVDPAARGGLYLMLHAPIDGVIPGLPDHGLTWEYLESLGYRAVFAGHYHNHKHLGGHVYSVGNLTPQTWSDLNTKAGFLIVKGDDVQWYKSHAPDFVEIDGSTDPAEIPLIVDGNYVRVKINSAKPSDVEAMRDYLGKCGAVGVTVQQMKDPAGTPVRATGTLLKAGATLEQSINDFITAKSFDRQSELAVVCQDILSQVRNRA